MQRKQRVPNPYYRAIPIEWKLMTEEPSGLRDGMLELSFRTTDAKGNKSVMSFPCVVSDSKCFPQKVGTMKKIDPKGYCVRKEEFSIVEKYAERPSGYIAILNDVVEDVARAINSILSCVKNPGNLLKGVHLVNPKIMRIPKVITAQEISLEYLQEQGQLDSASSS
jgi:hypothetical protein